MTDYNRFISYLYYYKNGIKEAGAGHARVEQRAGVYKVSIRIKCNVINEGTWDAYFYSRLNSTGGLKSVKAGTVQVLRGESETVFECSKGHMEQSGIAFGKVEGMVFCLHKGAEFILSDWEEGELSSGEVKSIYAKEGKESDKPEAAKASSDIQTEWISSDSIETIPFEALLTDTVHKEETEIKELPIADSTIKKVQTQDIRMEIPVAAVTEELTEQCTKFSEEIPLDFSIPPDCFGKRMPWQDPPEVEEIFRSHERVHPFHDGEIAECVKIEPKDIGKLPVEFWTLGNNSFLLHSFCNYKYLLFAKRMNRIKCEYLLMIPGVYQQREKLMAKMFGFDYFKCAKCREQRLGEFGFWYMMIRF